MRRIERVILAGALLQLGACERPERTHNDRNQPSGTDPASVSSSKTAPSQRDNSGAAGVPRPSSSTPVSGTPDARANPPRDPASAPDASQSAGPSAAGRVDAKGSDAARAPVQAGSRKAPYGHDTSTLADERPADAEPIGGQ